MALSAGARVGHYEITGPLGAGGMGEVYRARDSKLGRDVAIKVLPASLADDADYMARFQREAHTLASLNHANIAAIYGVEANAIVMELVEGQTLAERIAEGPIAFAEALPIALQIAEALEAAHEKAIVHRDLKPANVKVTPEGNAKVLDFGLAKATEQAAAASAMTVSPTLTIRATQAGLIMGTAGYMAPEQAACKAVDKRADVWAFGVVLVEMLTGKQLFEGETISHTLAHVLTARIDLNELPGSTPPAIRALALRCLDRNPKSRLRDIGEARIAIQRCLANPSEEAAAVPAPARSPQRVIPWAAALGIALVVGGVGWWRATRPSELRPLVRMNVEMSPDMPMMSFGSGGVVALSPDGRRVAVTLHGTDGKTRIYTRLLHQSVLTPLAGTDNGSSPFFSPDGQWIGFAADGKVKKISVEGGAAVTVCEAVSMRGGSWGDDGNIVFAPSAASGLLRVSAAGGTPAPLTKLSPGERTHRWPHVLPGSQTILLTVHSGSNNYDGANIDVFSTTSGERRTLLHGGFYGRYVATPDGSGRLVYTHQGTLFAAPFDARRRTLSGTALPILEDVSSSGNGGGDFASADTGTLIYLAGKGQRGLWTIAWVDTSGKLQPLHAPLGSFFTPRFSADGKRLAFTVGTGAVYDLWVKDLDRDTSSRLSFLEGTNNWPVWTPDGKYIVFKSTGSSAPGLYWIRSDGAGEALRLSDETSDAYPYSFSSDGKRLAFSMSNNGSASDLFTAQVEGDPAHPKLGKAELFLGTPLVEAYPAFSPDSRWLAYMSQETGANEVYVRPFPGPGGRWQISSGGGSFPIWSRNGRELLYKGGDQRIMAVDYTAKGDSFTASKPRVWADVQVMTFGTLSTWDLAPDGKRLAVLSPEIDAKQKPLTHLTFIENFADELQRRGTSGK